MRKLWQIVAVGSATLLLVGIVVAPFLLYLMGIPWLPAKPRASDSQLALVYMLDIPLITVTTWLLKSIRAYFHQRQGSVFNIKSQATRLSQIAHITRYPTIQTGHNDPIVIGGGREKEQMVCLLCCTLGFFVAGCGICMYVGLLPDNSGFHLDPKFLGLFFLGYGLALMVIGILILPYGKPHECLQIGSEGIAYSWKSKDRLFIPWNQIDSAYVAVSILNSYLFVALESDSPLFFQEPIKTKFDKKQGRSGAVAVCQISDSPSATLPKHLVEKALDIYAPSEIGRHKI